MSAGVNPQPYADALYALISGLSQFKTKSQNLRSYADVPAGDQPHVCVPDSMGIRMTQSGRMGMPAKIWFDAKVWIYARTGAEIDTTTGHVINPLISAVTAAIEPVGYLQTLGGLVHHCQIEGKIITDQGLIGQQGMAIIPVQIYLFGH